DRRPGESPGPRRASAADCGDVTTVNLLRSARRSERPIANSRKDRDRQKRNRVAQARHRHRFVPRRLVSTPELSGSPAEQSAARFEPYCRLVRSLLPRASSLAIFSAAGELYWSSDTMTGPDLMNAVE